MNDTVRIFARPEVFTMVKDNDGQIAEFQIKGYDKTPYQDGVITVPVYGKKGIRSQVIHNSQNYEGWLVIEAEKDVKLSVQEHIIVDGFDMYSGGKVEPVDVKDFVNVQNRKIKQAKLTKTMDDFTR